MYVHWVQSFIRFHRLRRLRTLSVPQTEVFLSWLASKRTFLPSTQ